MQLHFVEYCEIETFEVSVLCHGLYYLQFIVLYRSPVEHSDILEHEALSLDYPPRRFEGT